MKLIDTIREEAAKAGARVTVTRAATYLEKPGHVWRKVGEHTLRVPADQYDSSAQEYSAWTGAEKRAFLSETLAEVRAGLEPCGSPDCAECAEILNDEEVKP